MATEPRAGGRWEPDRLKAALEARFPQATAEPDRVRIVRAPGRVNLIGEHTDYNEGLVLPAAIDLDIRIAFIPTGDRRVDIALADGGGADGFDLDAIGPRTGGWVDYVAGTAWSLAEAGVATGGLRGVLASDLPQSAGLSSSAALELASAWALTGGTGGGVDGMTLARICQRAENEYVGARVGLMDQFASSLGVDGAALLLDCRSLDWRPVAIPFDDHVLAVCHTGSARRLVASEYNLRRAQCEAGVAALAALDPSIRTLRDVTPAMLPRLRSLTDEVTYRRCEHVVHENGRVLATIEAFTAGDLGAVGRLFAASHASLRDLFEVVSPELDSLVEIASGCPGVAAARMTGAGFGGCTVNLVAEDAVPALRAAVARDYPARTGLTPRVWTVRPSAGAGPLRA
jgi:galactokinase